MWGITNSTNIAMVARETMRNDARLDVIERKLEGVVMSNPVTFTQKNGFSAKLNNENVVLLFANGPVGDLSRGFIRHQVSVTDNSDSTYPGAPAVHEAGKWTADLPVAYSVNGNGFPYANQQSRFFMTAGMSILSGGMGDVNLGGTVDAILFNANTFGINSGTNTISITIPTSIIPPNYDDPAITDNGENATIAINLANTTSTGIQAVRDILNNPTVYLLRAALFTESESVSATAYA